MSGTLHIGQTIVVFLAAASIREPCLLFASLAFLSAFFCCACCKGDGQVRPYTLAFIHARTRVGDIDDAHARSDHALQLTSLACPRTIRATRQSVRALGAEASGALREASGGQALLEPLRTVHTERENGVL